MQKIIIAAVSLNGVIGNRNKMPWKLKDEILFFKETTIGNAVLMGNKTFNSIGEPLKERLNLVLSESKKNGEVADNLFYFNSVNSAINFAEDSGKDKLFVIGGGNVFAQTVNMVDELIISRIPIEVEGDTFFPVIDDEIWKLSETEDHVSFNVERYLKRNEDE